MRRYILASFGDLRYWSRDTYRDFVVVSEKIAQLGASMEEVTRSMYLLRSTLSQPPFLGYTVDKP